MPDTGGFACASSACEQQTVVLVEPLLEFFKQALLPLVLPPTPELSTLAPQFNQHQGQLQQRRFGG